MGGNGRSEKARKVKNHRHNKGGKRDCDARRQGKNKPFEQHNGDSKDKTLDDDLIISEQVEEFNRIGMMADGNNVVKRKGGYVENTGDTLRSAKETTTNKRVMLCSYNPQDSHDLRDLQARLAGTSAPSVDMNSQLYRRLELKVKREETVLWRQPLLTLNYFFHEVFILLKNYGLKLWKHKKTVLLCLFLVLIVTALYLTQGPHRMYLEKFHTKILWCTYWVGLGVLSSIGLGTGLHTFLLYLGPHIASVTLAAYECGSLEFPSPPYPDELICPDKRILIPKIITIWNIMSKVRLEAFMWGAGTALGELPPYFMARAARLSGYDPEEEDLMRFEQLINQQNQQQQSSLDRAKLIIERLVERVGFFGILACASIPNPLFDLAGITCGHFLVPFWTFFGATLIGKAIVKMHIQKMFVIIAFNEDMLAKAVHGISFVPYVGKYLQVPFKEFLVKQKAKLHRAAGTAAPMEGSWLSWIFEKFVIAMVIYFILSIINSLAQSYHKRLHKQLQQERK